MILMPELYCLVQPDSPDQPGQRSEQLLEAEAAPDPPDPAALPQRGGRARRGALPAPARAHGGHRGTAAALHQTHARRAASRYTQYTYIDTYTYTYTFSFGDMLP